MRFKSFKLFPVVILITLLSLFLFGCGKQGSRFGNKAPTISITSYEGYDPSVPFTDSTEVTLFQQKIFWHAIDTDGVVNEYAYRILNDNDEPIRTAGNTFLDMYGEVDKAAFDKFGGGWVLHYKPGANQSIPLDSTGAKRTIWTTQKYAVVNFSANYLGEADTTIANFRLSAEIIVKPCARRTL